MGAFTTSQALPYPWIDDLADPNQLRDLALAIDAKVVAHLAQRDIVRKRPYAKMAKLTSTTITTGVVTTLTFDTEIDDTHAIVNLGTNNTRFTIPASQAGVYFVTVSAVNLVFGVAVTSELTIRHNATDRYRKKGQAKGHDNMAAGYLNMAVADFVDFQFWHDAGVNATIAAVYATIYKVSDT